MLLDAVVEWWMCGGSRNEVVCELVQHFSNFADAAGPVDCKVRSG